MASSASSGLRNGATTALDAASGVTKKQKQSASGATFKSLEELVSKAIIDNLKGWTLMELDVNRDADGKTCREVIRERKELHLQDKRKYPCGKHFWAEIKATFRSGDSPQKVLTAMGPKEGPIQEPLLRAMMLYKKTGTRAAMMSFLETCGDISRFELSGLLQFALEQRASTSFDQMRVSKALLNVFASKNFVVKYPDEMAHVTSWIDDTLCYLYMKSKQMRVKPSEFISCNRPLVMLVLPMKETDALINHVGDWTEKESEVVTVVNGSNLGRSIFGFAIEQVLGEVVSREITLQIDELLKNAVINAEILASYKRQVVKGLQARPGMDSLSGKRDITISYRGVEFKIKVSSLMEEVEIRFAAHLKSLTVQCCDLLPLMCEDELVVDILKGTKGQVDESVLRTWRAARQSCNDAIRATGQIEGTSMIAFLTKKEAALRSVDSTFLMEIRFFSELVGEAGEKILQDKIRCIMPTADKAVSEADALNQLKVLQGSDIFKFTGVASQSVVCAVSSLIASLHEGRKPTFATNPSPFMTEMKVMVGHFCRITVPDNGTVSELSGPKAAEAMLAAINKKKKISLEALEGPVKFSWLLSPSSAAKVEELRKDALKEATATFEAASAKPGVASNKRNAASSSSGSAPNLKKGKVASSELDAAMAMFKGLA
jgi:hypothetical protein